MPANTAHQAFPQPTDPAIKIWRYMDFAKYVAMLKDRSLHFRRVDTFDDPFEGSLSKNEFDRLSRRAQAGETEGRLPLSWRGKYLDILLGNARRSRKECYANCWHMNPIESEAMWRLYSASEYAIAIVSTYACLAECLPSAFPADKVADHMRPYLGVVTYNDHHRDSFPTDNAFYPIMHKRSAFEHEHECRAVIWRVAKGDWPDGVPDSILDNYPAGLNVPVPLESLILEVIVSPSAPSWFAEVVADSTARYGFGFLVQQSSLVCQPYL